MSERSFQRLASQLDEMARIASRPEADLAAVAPKVSGWSTAQHLDHSLKVCTFFLRGVVEPKEKPARGLNLLGRVMITVGRFPRGRGKAPKAVVGVAIPPGQIAAAIDAVRDLAKRAASSPHLGSPEPILPHPYFGGLTAAQAVRFTTIHTDHHLRIVADVLRAPR